MPNSDHIIKFTHNAWDLVGCRHALNQLFADSRAISREIHDDFLGGIEKIEQSKRIFEQMQNLWNTLPGDDKSIRYGVEKPFLDKRIRFNAFLDGKLFNLENSGKIDDKMAMVNDKFSTQILRYIHGIIVTIRKTIPVEYYMSFSDSVPQIDPLSETAIKLNRIFVNYRTVVEGMAQIERGIEDILRKYDSLASLMAYWPIAEQIANMDSRFLLEVHPTDNLSRHGTLRSLVTPMRNLFHFNHHTFDYTLPVSDPGTGASSPTGRQTAASPGFE